MFEKFSPGNLPYPNNQEDDKLAKAHGVQIDSIENELARIEKGYLTDEALELNKDGVSEVKEDLTEAQINLRVEQLKEAIQFLQDEIDTLPKDAIEKRNKLEEFLKVRQRMLHGLQNMISVNHNQN